jgi:hypothetical protein
MWRLIYTSRPGRIYRARFAERLSSCQSRAPTSVLAELCTCPTRPTPVKQTCRAAPSPPAVFLCSHSWYHSDHSMFMAPLLVTWAGPAYGAVTTCGFRCLVGPLRWPGKKLAGVRNDMNTFFAIALCSRTVARTRRAIQAGMKIVSARRFSWRQFFESVFKASSGQLRIYRSPVAAEGVSGRFRASELRGRDGSISCCRLGSFNCRPRRRPGSPKIREVDRWPKDPENRRISMTTRYPSAQRQGRRSAREN